MLMADMVSSCGGNYSAFKFGSDRGKRDVVRLFFEAVSIDIERPLIAYIIEKSPFRTRAF